jgi:hypothetical protein
VAKEAIGNAKWNIDSIGEEFFDHPLVNRTRDAVSEFPNQ